MKNFKCDKVVDRGSVPQLAQRIEACGMDDQIDGRTLVGAYVSADRPGEFRWQPGSLTQAVQNGLWIVFEDINKAPSDLHSILMPLLEGAVSFATGHGEVVTLLCNRHG
ncbi:Midasin [Glycine soja]|nr:Midasin [Glycine soja]